MWIRLRLRIALWNNFSIFLHCSYVRRMGAQNHMAGSKGGLSILDILRNRFVRLDGYFPNCNLRVAVANG